MDKYYVKTFQELNNMQSKISSLFQDLLVERYHYKLSSDKLKKNLEEVSMEVRNLKMKNEKLQQEYQELKNLIQECVKIFKCLDLSESNLVIKDRKIVLDTIKRILSQTNNLNPESLEADVTMKNEISLSRNDHYTTGCKISQADIKKEIDAIKDLQLTTQFFDTTEISKEMDYLDENHSYVMLENLFEGKSNEKTDNFEKPVIVQETEVFGEKNPSVGPEIQQAVNPLNEVKTSKKNLLYSPVFKDFCNRKQENLSTGENGADDASRRINQKLFLRSSDFCTSPNKKPSVRTCSVSPKREMPSPNRIRKKPRIDSPKKSAINLLKKSNSREAEISVSGVRKLTQTLLNIECFKLKTPEKRKNGEIFENENAEQIKAYEAKLLGDVDEDDVIMESPKKLEPVLEDVKNMKKSESGLNKIASAIPCTTFDADLDETYVSASVIKKCQMTGEHILEKIDEDQTPIKRPNSERIPDCDSVPFLYKRGAVRSKKERMKLPGHACVECNKYYQYALKEDLSPGKLKEILNKCSRHRDKNSPSIDDTPPGYWKPYLTASVMNKDDTTIQ